MEIYNLRTFTVITSRYLIKQNMYCNPLQLYQATFSWYDFFVLNISYFDSEYSMVPTGVPASPDISGMEMEERDFSRMGIPT